LTSRKLGTRALERKRALTSARSRHALQQTRDLPHHVGQTLLRFEEVARASTVRSRDRYRHAAELTKTSRHAENFIVPSQEIEDQRYEKLGHGVNVAAGRLDVGRCAAISVCSDSHLPGFA